MRVTLKQAPTGVEAPAFDAWRFSEDTAPPPFIGMAMQRADIVPAGHHESLGALWKVNTSGGRVEAMTGDWLLRALDGKLYVYNDEAFRSTFMQHKDPWVRDEVLAATVLPDAFDVVSDVKPDAVHETFGFSTALAWLKKGAKVKRADWEVPLAIVSLAATGESKRQQLVWLHADGTRSLASLFSENLLAEDWSVVQ